MTEELMQARIARTDARISVERAAETLAAHPNDSESFTRLLVAVARFNAKNAIVQMLDGKGE